MNVVMRKIDEIKPYAKKPRINDDAVDAVAASLAEYGWQQPIVVDVHGVIILRSYQVEGSKEAGHEKGSCPRGY